MLKQLLNKKKFYYQVAASIALLTAAGYAMGVLLEGRAEAEKLEIYGQLLPRAMPGIAENFDEKADGVRKFVNQGTAHKINEEYRRIRDDHAEIVRQTLAFAEGRQEQGPPLECSARADMMEAMLMADGQRVRSVSVYAWDEEAGQLRSHRFLEVQNPETSAWQIQDPDLDLFWIVKESGRRAGIEDLLALDTPEDALPCQTPHNCGWDLVSREGMDAARMRKYMALALIKDHQEGNKRILLVNENRFDLDRELPYGGKMQTYCAHIPKNCRGEVRVF